MSDSPRVVRYPVSPPQAPTPATQIEQGQALRFLLARFRPVRRRAYGVFLLVMLRSVLEIAGPFLLAGVIGTLIVDASVPDVLPDDYVTLTWLLAGSYVLKLIVFYVAQVESTRLGQQLENTLRRDLFAHVAALRFVYHDENRSGKTIARSLRDMERTKRFFREVWFGYLEVGLLVVAVLALIFSQHWTYGVVVLVIYGLGISGCVYTGRKIANMDREASDLYDGVTTVLQENIAGARVVRAFGREPSEIGKFGAQMDGMTQSWARLERYWTTVMPSVNHTYYLTVPLILLIGAQRVSLGLGGIAEVTMVLLACRLVQHRIRPLTRLIIVGQQALASASRVFEVLERRELIEASAAPLVLPKQGGHLQIDNVHFGHAADKPILKGVTLDIPAGGSLGIIGPTGAGKSTLVQLLPRFYDPDAGRIRLDGIDLQDLDVRALRREVGLVFQEPFLFSGTVTDNVAYGRPEITFPDVERFVGLSAAGTFVNALPKGYETLIGERGVSLSGGQRQRLTIARALAMSPRLLVFDDATASVDAVTERELYAGIREAAEGRTTIVISQRVTSVKWCDRIAVLDDGVITAVGTHAELLKTSPLYGEIEKHQRLTGTQA